MIFKSVVILFVLNQIDCGVTKKLSLAVYYESKCSDSKVFILEQLQPAVALLHDYVVTKLVPFGKANSVNNGDSGFVCQHGPPECLGNIFQDCALHHMEKESDVKKVAYVACEMGTGAASEGKLDCVEGAGLDPRVIEDCTLTGKGTVLQLQSEYSTKIIKPKFVPTVTINGEFDQAIQDNAMVDLVGTLCAIMTEVPPCARLYNTAAFTSLLFPVPLYNRVSL